jgi:hypothetical protein
MRVVGQDSARVDEERLDIEKPPHAGLCQRLKLLKQQEKPRLTKSSKLSALLTDLRREAET